MFDGTRPFVNQQPAMLSLQSGAQIQPVDHMFVTGARAYGVGASVCIFTIYVRTVTSDIRVRNNGVCSFTESMVDLHSME